MAGKLSCKGSFTIDATAFPFMSQISTLRGNRENGNWYENGLSMRSAKMYLPSGEKSALLNIAGAPILRTLPEISITASCDVQ